MGRKLNHKTMNRMISVCSNISNSSDTSIICPYFTSYMRRVLKQVIHSSCISVYMCATVHLVMLLNPRLKGSFQLFWHIRPLLGGPLLAIM